MTSSTLAQTDEAVLERLYRTHASFVWRNARRFGASDAWVDDVVHEVFLVLIQKLHEFRGDATIRTWLFAVTYRVVRRMVRDRARDRQKVEQHAAEHLEPRHPEPQAAAASTLRRMLSALDETKRLVFVLVELEGMTSREVASMLAVPVGTVDTRLRAARTELSRLAERHLAMERRTS